MKNRFQATTRRVTMFEPHYYLMTQKKILRLESDQRFSDLSWMIQGLCLDSDTPLDQDKANWRVAIFRDEILDLNEYLDFLNSNSFAEMKEAI